MAGIDIRRFLNNFGQNYAQQRTFAAKGTFNAQSQTSNVAPKVEVSVPKSTPQPVVQTQVGETLQLNTLQSMDRAVYARELFQMPRNINEFVYMLQRGLTQGQFNLMYANQLAMQRNSLSQLQAQILAQLQGLNTTMTKEIVNVQLSSQLQSSLKNLEILSGGMINLADISVLLQKNGKEALTKLIMTMTEASKAGITDLTQMKEMAKLINASISIASENNPQKTLKLLLMLYLPWLPLEDGVGFDLEVETKSGGEEESDSVLTVTVTTKNFGTVIATIFLETSNSVQIAIECNDKFPKEELQLRMDSDKKQYSMDTVTTYNINKDLKPNTDKASANVNMSQTTEINPYLLLTAHSIIRHVIEIDNNATLGITSHSDNF